MEDELRVGSDLGKGQRGREGVLVQTAEGPRVACPVERRLQLDGLEAREKAMPPDSCIGDGETPYVDGEPRCLKERVSDLEGLLKNKEVAERDLSQRVSQLDRCLAEKSRKEHLLLARCARLKEVLRQKEAVEARLQERYSQVEELQQEWETSEEEHEEQIRTLVGEIAERDAVQARLEEAHGDMVRRMEEMSRCRRRLEARIQQLEEELAGAGSGVEDPGVTEKNPGKNPAAGDFEDPVRSKEEADSPGRGREVVYQSSQEARSTDESPAPNTDGSSSRVARLEKLLELREETVEELQGRLGGQEQLLGEMQETQRRLSARNEELGSRQRELSEEVHRWRARGSGMEQQEREWRTEAAQLRGTIAQLEALSASLESKLRTKDSELQALEAAKEREASSLWADLRRLTSEQSDREAAWLSDRQGLEAQLRKRSRELEASEEEQRKLRQTQEALEEERCRLRQAEGALVQKNQALEVELAHLSQLLTSTEDTLARERQAPSASRTRLTSVEQSVRALQEEKAALHMTIKQLKEELGRARRERSTPASEEPAAEVTPELQVLSKRVKVLEHTLRDNINTFTESEAALQHRIKELEVSERNLLVKVNDLTARSDSLRQAAPRQRQEEKLHMLREEVRSMALDKERCDRVWKERLHRCQNQMRAKEEEMKRQSEYFEHYKQKLQLKLGFSKEREQSLEGRVFQLERQVIDLTASAAQLRTELERRGPVVAPPPEEEQEVEEEEEEGGSGNEGRLKSFVGRLQADLRELLGREEAGLAERRALREGLQDAEDNVEFLSHKLEDFRSRIHQLKLSESALLEEVEELAEENERLRGGLQITNRLTDPGPTPNPAPNPDPSPTPPTPCRTEPGPQDLGPVDSTDSMGCVLLGEDKLQSRQEVLLDPPAKNKAAQTPSVTHCIREAIAVAKLIPHLVGSSRCSCGGLLEGSFFPLLESNSWDVVEIMQAMRCGGLEQVKQTLKQMESQCRLPVLECESTPLPANREGAVESLQPEAVILSKHKETIVIQSQPDLLSLCGLRNQNTNLISLVTKTIEVDCNPGNSDTANTERSFRSYSFGTFKPPSEQTNNSLKETLLSLESEVESLQNNKKEMERVLHSKEESLQRASEEIARLKMSQAGGSFEGREASAGERGDLQLETLKNNWRQENKVLGRRNEELLEQIARLEEDYERELAQLRLQISLQERDVSRLEEENGQQGRTIAELQQKTDDDLNVVLELQEALREKNEQIAFLQCKTEEDLNVIMELQDTVQEKGNSNQEDPSCSSIAPGPEESTRLKASLEESREVLSHAQAERARLQELVDRLGSERQLDSQMAAELREEAQRLSCLASGQEAELQQARAERDGLEGAKQDLSARLEGLSRSNGALARKVEEQQEALKISSEMISDLQAQRDAGAREAATLREAHAASQRDLLALREANEAVSAQLREQEDAKQQLACVQQERTRLQGEADLLRTQHVDLLEQRERESQTLDEKNKDLSEKTVALEERGREVSEREAQLREEADSLRRENQALSKQIQMLEAKTGQEASRDANSLAPKGRELQMAKDAPGGDSAVHRFEPSKQEMPKELKPEDSTLSPRHKMAPEITQRSQATVFSYKTVSLGSTFQEQSSALGEDSNLQKELETMATDLKHYKEELEKTKAEAQKWYRELGLAEAKGEEAEKKASQAVNEAKRMRECVKEAEEMKRKNDRLKEEQVFQSRDEETVLVKRDEIVEVRGRMAELERGRSDTVSVKCQQEEQLTLLQSQLKAKSAVENELRAEIEALKSQQGKLEDKSDTVRALQARYDDIRQQFDELLQKKTQMDLDIAPLKAKLSYVVQKCQERNSLIVQMIRTLRRYGCIDCALTQEAEDLVNDTALLEYSSAFLPAANRTQEACRNLWEARKTKEEEGSVQHSLPCRRGGLSDVDTSLSFRLCVAKADYCPSPEMPQTMLPTLPLSAGDAVQVTGVPDSRGLYHAEVKGEAGLVPASFIEEREDLNNQVLPSAGSCSGSSSKLSSPEKIISLHQQLQQSHFSNYQVVSSAGPNSNVEMVRGPLAPPCPPPGTLSDFSEPPEPARRTHLCWKRGEEGPEQEQEEDQPQARGSEFGDLARRAVRDTAVVLNNTCPSRVCTSSPASCSTSSPATHSGLSDLPPPNSQDRDVRGGFSNTLFTEARSARAKQEPPAAVGSLDVIKTVGQSSLMIGWDRPPLDELGCSNGTFVYGYRIYVDGEFHKSVMSSACTKAVLENLDLSVPVHISVQTLGSNGLFAEKVHVLHKSSSPPAGTAPPTPDLRPLPLRRPSGTTQPLIYRSLALKASSPKSVKPVMFVAVYNYSPLKDSPNIHPTRELAFREGDTVWVFGTPRRDGFCEAEVNGRRGLAPVAFLEEIAMGPPKSVTESETGFGTVSPGAEDVAPCPPSCSPCPPTTPHQHGRKPPVRRL
ncbi:rootletin-like isoform X1 [Anguilla rostrata]|uniref:rootletin-like isoform X1 n=1 Tax=Anguilla rostrata TaxID=7938 RepID=UPI0030CF8534